MCKVNPSEGVLEIKLALSLNCILHNNNNKTPVPSTEGQKQPLNKPRDQLYQGCVNAFLENEN